MAAAKQKPAAFADRLGSLKQSRESVQAEMRQAHDDIQRQIANLKEQRQTLSSARATKAEIVAVAEKSIRTEAENFERRQREHGLGQLQGRSAAILVRPPNVEGLEGAQNMKLREAATRSHRERLFSVLFAANGNPREGDGTSAATMAQFVAWAFGDQIIERVKEFADGLEDAPDGDVRESELARIDAEIQRLQDESEQLRMEAAQAGLKIQEAA